MHDPNAEGMKLCKFNRDYEDRMEQEHSKQEATRTVNKASYNVEEEVQL